MEAKQSKQYFARVGCKVAPTISLYIKETFLDQFVVVVGEANPKWGEKNVKFLQINLSPISLPCGFGGGGLDIITIVSSSSRDLLELLMSSSFSAINDVQQKNGDSRLWSWIHIDVSVVVAHGRSFPFEDLPDSSSGVLSSETKYYWKE